MSKNIDSGLIGIIKRFYLKYIIGYENRQRYWNKRYRLMLKTDFSQETFHPEKITQFTLEIDSLMRKYNCQNILEIGCGRGKHRTLKGWVGLDFSINILKQSGLQEYIVADFTSHIPVPDKTFDCVMCQSVLLHVPLERIGFVASEMCRVSKKLIIVSEPIFCSLGNNFSFGHDIETLFKSMQFGGKIEFVEATV